MSYGKSSNSGSVGNDNSNYSVGTGVGGKNANGQIASPGGPGPSAQQQTDFQSNIAQQPGPTQGGRNNTGGFAYGPTQSQPSMSPQSLSGQYASNIFGTPAASYQPDFNGGPGQTTFNNGSDLALMGNPFGLPNGQQFDMSEDQLPGYDPYQPEPDPGPYIDDGIDYRDPALDNEPYYPEPDPYQPPEDPFQPGPEPAPIEDPFQPGPEPEPGPIDQPVNGGPGLTGGPGYGDQPVDNPVVEPPPVDNPFIPGPEPEPIDNGPVPMPIMGDPIFNQPEPVYEQPVYGPGGPPQEPLPAPDDNYFNPGDYSPYADFFQPTAVAMPGANVNAAQSINPYSRGLPRDQFGQLQSRLDTARRFMQPGQPGPAKDQFGQLTTPMIRPPRGTARR